MKFTVGLMNGDKRTVEAESYEEKPDGFITFWSNEIGQVASIRKNDIKSIDSAS